MGVERISRDLTLNTYIRNVVLLPLDVGDERITFNNHSVQLAHSVVVSSQENRYVRLKQEEGVCAEFLCLVTRRFMWHSVNYQIISGTTENVRRRFLLQKQRTIPDSCLLTEMKGKYSRDGHTSDVLRDIHFNARVPFVSNTNVDALPQLRQTSGKA